MKNLLRDIPAALRQEVIEILLEADCVRIERIISHGQCSPDGFWYDQDQHEWVAVLQGSARSQFEDRTVELLPGDWLYIPAHQLHRVEWTTPKELTVWLAIFWNPTVSLPG